MKKIFLLPLVTIGLLSIHCVARADGNKVLCDFERPADLKMWEVPRGTAKLVAEGMTSGDSALQLSLDANQGAYITTWRLPQDWSEYDALVLDVVNPNEKPIRATILVGDQAWQDKGGTYWNRHNGGRSFGPGKSEWVLPVRGFYRGEAGSRNNDIKRNIDPDHIVRLDFGFKATGAARVIVDNLRLVKLNAPKGVWAFDFGPPDQSLMLGWMPVSNETAYTTQRGYGWGPSGGRPWDGAARDTTFGTALLQDFCAAGGYNFHVDAPPGTYHVKVVFENSGYWGGEQAQQRQRRILANGREVWQEERPDGSAHALYRFENTEPIDVDIWDTYMAPELARAAEFTAHVTDAGLTLRFETDRSWGSKVAGITIVRSADVAGRTWVEDQEKRLAKEFRGKALCLDDPPRRFTVPAAWKARRLVAWPVKIEEEVTPHSVPESLSDGPDQLVIERTAVQGEYEPFCVAIRPSVDLGQCRLRLEPLRGPGEIDAELSSVWYNTSRGFGQIAYHVRPHTLRPATTVTLTRDVTRELIVTALVRRSTPAGQYHGAIVLENDAGQLLLRVPLVLAVHPVVLDRSTDYQMGFFGLMPPGLIPHERRWEVLDQTLQMLRRHGMNAVSGGPSWKLAGWRDGRPIIDYGDMDRFFALLKKHGFTAPINGYGGIRFQGLNQRYEIGDIGAKVARDSGLSYDAALMRAWRAVDEHARAAGWPTIFYAMCDETRVRDQAERELVFMRAMRKVSAAFPRTVRTSGSYSVTFKDQPKDKNNLLYWHQQFFETLDVNSLNNHDPTVMAAAANQGSVIHIYNQGRTRYSFGLYQWSECRKGVQARWQWHLNVLHGYQFFDLDGREPDTAAICYGRERLYPTIHFERCREGAEDFYLYNTLWKHIRQCEQTATVTDACRAAKRWLEDTTRRIALNQRQPPGDYDADTLKQQCIRALEELATR